ncbi:MAG: aminodeoxychorismate lyase [Candidatus Eutrophobiaceae bacterium]
MLASLVNGNVDDCISILDRGLQFGDGLFETLPVLEGQPLCLGRHLARLRAGCIRLSIPFPEILPEEVETLLSTRPENCSRAVMKIILTRGCSARGYGIPSDASPNRILNLFPWPDSLINLHDHGVAVEFSEHRCYAASPELAGLKHLNRLPQVMARRIFPEGCFETLLLDDLNYVIEGTMSNVFASIDGRWLTPDLRGAGIEGVIRSCILEDCPAGETAQVAELCRNDLLDADEIFLTNSLIGIVPVRRLAEREFDSFTNGHKIAAHLRNLHCLMPVDT